MVSFSQQYDIVIVDAGPAGLMLGVFLARWGYKIKHIDNRPEPTRTGRADGIQPRSLDLLKNLNLKRDIMAHAPTRVYEVAFWDPQREARIPGTPTPLCCIKRVFIKDMARSGTQVDRPWTITAFRNDGQDSTYPVEVEFQHVDTKKKENGEGARSFVREQLGIQIHHKDPISHVWSVMDGVVRTDFPDINMKCTIHSDDGSIMIIPRENNLVRLFIQVASSTDKDWNPRAQLSEAQVQASAKKILRPYFMQWERVEWYSVYPIGQGIAERYTLDERVFMGGDACHTHSPKAGQGMNTAFLDAQNLAWKIDHVESGFASRSVLKSYESERRSVAKNLLDFDNKYARLFSERQPSPDEVSSASASPSSGSLDPASSADTPANQFIELFKSSCEFTSGYGVAYHENLLNWHPDHPAKSPLFHPSGTTLRTGRIFPPANVVRVVDANEVHLENEIPANGSFRILVFAGVPGLTRRAVADFASNLSKPRSFYTAFEREDIATVSHHERHNPHSRFFTLCTIYNAKRPAIEIARDVPDLLARYTDHVYADEVWHARVPHAKAAAHAKTGLDEERGGVVVLGPDGYVACVVGLAEGSGTVDALNEYFGAFAARPIASEKTQARL